MKFIFENKLKEGKYYVGIRVTEILPEEKEKFLIFGVPRISILPKTVRYRGIRSSTLPLNEIRNVFVFDDEKEASAFSQTIKERIKSTIETLKNLTDEFSKEEQEEYEI